MARAVLRQEQSATVAPETGQRPTFASQPLPTFCSVPPAPDPSRRVTPPRLPGPTGKPVAQEGGGRRGETPLTRGSSGRRRRGSPAPDLASTAPPGPRATSRAPPRPPPASRQQGCDGLRRPPKGLGRASQRETPACSAQRLLQTLPLGKLPHAAPSAAAAAAAPEPAPGWTASHWWRRGQGGVTAARSLRGGLPRARLSSSRREAVAFLTMFHSSPAATGAVECIPTGRCGRAAWAR